MLYFSGDTEVGCPFGMPNADFVAKFPGRKAYRFDSFSVLVGYVMDGKHAVGNPLPIDRKVNFKKHPSLHHCGSRCLNAKGHDCECSCHGKNHGAGRSFD